jgi:hypothetical protein
LTDIVLVNNHLTKDKNGMLHSMFEKAGRAPFAINLPTDSAEELIWLFLSIGKSYPITLALKV